MKMEETNLNQLSQQDYENIKMLNQKSFELIQEFLVLLNITLYNFVEELGIVNNIWKINELKKIIDAQSCVNFKKNEKLIELGNRKYTNNTKSNCIRYYYDDVYSTITTPVTQQIKMLKKFTKKIIKMIQLPSLRKEFEKIRAKIIRELSSLEKEQNSLIIKK